MTDSVQDNPNAIGETVVKAFWQMMREINMDDVPFRILAHGPFALLALEDTIYAIGHLAQTQDRWKIAQQLANIKVEKPQFSSVNIQFVTGEQILALVATGWRYSGFHHNSSDWIITEKLISRRFWILGKAQPNYKRIETILRRAGFTPDHKP